MRVVDDTIFPQLLYIEGHDFPYNDIISSHGSRGKFQDGSFSA
ncbi:hypothetical protein Mpsy_2304 [Methanolobus psychrophilus R15]|nr:hypothetical protein Mpsy_2304 [Methanolobus psychrophilus R15]